MVAKPLHKLMETFKKSCMDDVSAKPPLLQQPGNLQDAESKHDISEVSRHRPLTKKIASAVSGITFSRTPVGKRFSISGEDLEASNLQPCIIAHYGIPATACTMALDPLEDVFAVATRDGRIKIFDDSYMEILLQSPTHAQCHFLQFMYNQWQLVNVTTTNVIEVWDLRRKCMSACYKWDKDITACAVVQGTPFVYIGDETGKLKVIQYDADKAQLCLLPYSISTNLTLGEFIKGFPVPAVIGILPQPQKELERVLIAYRNGMTILWQLRDSQVLAARGFSCYRVQEISENNENTMSTTFEKEDKELSCVCWTCQNGSLFAAGYTDGDVWLWSLPSVSKPKDGSGYSSIPAVKIQICSGATRMPIFMLKWWPVPGSDNRQGRGGHLCVFGGEQFGDVEVLKVIPLKDIDRSKPKRWLELPLHGPLADFVAVPSSGRFSSVPTTIYILVSPCDLFAYDIDEISELMTNSKDGRCLSQPEYISIKLPISESSVTVAKLFLIQRTGMTSDGLLQLPRVLESVFPAIMWPLSGGKQSENPVTTESKEEYMYITGHDCGLVNIWNVSASHIYSLCHIETKKRPEDLDKEASPITAFDFCTTSGFLTLGKKCGLILLYKLANELGDVKDAPAKKGSGLGTVNFQFMTIFDMHQAPISFMVISAAQECLATGCKSGTLSLINLKTRSLLYCGKCFGSNLEIISLKFASIPLCNPGFAMTLTQGLPYLRKRKPNTVAAQAVVLIAVSKDASVVILNGENGVCYSGPFKPKHSSVALSLYLLDVSGAPFAEISENIISIPVNSSDSRKKIESEEKLLSSVQGLVKSSKKLNNVDRGEEKSISATVPGSNLEYTSRTSHPSTDLLVLLCCEDMLRLYYMSFMLQGMRSPHLKIKLPNMCFWTSIFDIPSDRSCLILFYKTGELEFRSLPNMEVLKRTSLSTCLQWQVKPDSSLLRTISSTANGQTVWIDDDKELILLSFLHKKIDTRIQASLPHFHIKNTVAGKAQKKKGLIISAMKGIRGGVNKSSLAGEVTSVHHLSELAKIFGARNFSASCFYESYDGSQQNVSTCSETRDRELETDDNGLQAQNFTQQTFSSDSVHSPSLMRKVKGVLKGPRRAPKFDAASSSDVHHDLSGQRHLNPLYEVRCSDGHQETMNSSVKAANGREMVLKKDQKIQEINRHAADNDAEDFHSLTEELFKMLEKKKWGF